MAYALASRDLTAVDGAPVAATAVSLFRMPQRIVATFIVTTSGAPTGYDMRAAIEASNDGGTTWNQVCRFADITNAATSNRVVRSGGGGTAAEAAIAASALGSAQATPGSVVETPWPMLIRAVTKLQTLTGGTTPHVISSVLLEVS